MSEKIYFEDKYWRLNCNFDGYKKLLTCKVTGEDEHSIRIIDALDVEQIINKANITLANKLLEEEFVEARNEIKAMRGKKYDY